MCFVGNHVVNDPFDAARARSRPADGVRGARQLPPARLRPRPAGVGARAARDPRGRGRPAGRAALVPARDDGQPLGPARAAPGKQSSLIVDFSRDDATRRTRNVCVFHHEL